jgi:hypothetical protein
METDARALKVYFQVHQQPVQFRPYSLSVSIVHWRILAMSSEVKSKQAAGCVVAMIHMLLSFPLWFGLLWSILISIKAESWQWGMFYGYAVASFAAAGIGHLVKVAAGDE